MNATSPWHDPVVAEIHATRERLADQYHNDLLAYSKVAEARCRALGLNMAEDQHLHEARVEGCADEYPNGHKGSASIANDALRASAHPTCQI